MRRLFIIRKDLHLSAGKMSAMIGHCCEAYWTNLLKSCSKDDSFIGETTPKLKVVNVEIPYNIWDKYVNGIFTKTICECKNKNQLMKILDLINEYNTKILAQASLDPNIEEVKELVEGKDYGFINDKCLTELTPENEDGTTTIGIWFRPLPDDVAHFFSKKYKLYRD